MNRLLGNSFHDCGGNSPSFYEENAPKGVLIVWILICSSFHGASVDSGFQSENVAAWPT